MKKLYSIILTSFCLISALNGQENNEIVIGKIEQINSKILNEDRKIWIHVPDSNLQGGVIFAKKKYPVVYLLDGDDHFTQMVGIIDGLSRQNLCPKMIVVGIQNTNRTRDLSPSKAEPKPPYIPKEMAENSGGGANFMAFIEKELMPYIDTNYPTEPYKMFVGHSFGGLTTMNTLVETPNLFNSYISIDPAMHWNDRKLLKKIKKITFDKQYANKSLYLAIANSMKKGMDTLSVRKDTTFASEHMNALLDLNDILKKDNQNHLSYKATYYPNDNHGSVPLIAEYDALRYIFSFYHLDIDIEDLMNPETKVFELVQNHYKQLSSKFGIEKKPSEELMNNLGYGLMSTQQFKKAEQFFKLNTTNYPESFNAFDSLGDLYVAKGDKQKAIESFKKSVALNKDSYSKPKLEKLLKE